MKIVIWGHHPLHTSTHGYIHSTYAKAFQYLGNEVNWVPNSPNVDLDFSNSIFFVEDSQKSHIPLRKDCKYITHHIETKYLTDDGVPYQNVLKLGNCIQETEKFEKVENLKPDRYILITSMDLSSIQKDELKSLLNPYVKTSIPLESFIS